MRTGWWTGSLVPPHPSLGLPPPLLSPQHFAQVSQKTLNTVGRSAASLSPLKTGQPMFLHLGSPRAGSGAGLEWESNDVCGKTEGRADGKKEGSEEERTRGERSTRHHSRPLWLPRTLPRPPLRPPGPALFQSLQVPRARPEITPHKSPHPLCLF